MKRFIITEEEKNHIKGLYEQILGHEIGPVKLSSNKKEQEGRVNDKTHFTTAIKELPKYGFYVNKSQEKQGIISLEKPKGTPDDRDSILLMYVSPYGSYSAQVDYVITLQAKKNGKYIVDKKWKKNENFKMSDVINLIEKYNDIIFKNK